MERPKLSVIYEFYWQIKKLERLAYGTEYEDGEFISVNQATLEAKQFEYIRLLESLDGQPTAFQQWLNSQDEYSNLLKQFSSKKKFVMRCPDDISLPNEMLEKDAKVKLQAIICGVLLLYKNINTTFLNSLIAVSELDFNARPVFSDTTIGNMKRLLASLKKDLESAKLSDMGPEYKGFVNYLERKLKRAKGEDFSTVYAINLTNPRKRRLLIRECSILGNIYFKPQNSNQGRFFPAILASICKLVTGEEFTELRVIQKIQSNYDYSAVKNYEYSDEKPQANRPFSRAIFRASPEAEAQRRAENLLSYDKASEGHYPPDTKA
ncbi:hypothetical protein [Gilvimarinus agarilyticus]|uniref:hypothetical protein n=1 Tax=Gilvimarinus agarilyticus TaxID=679259 RepID=UPI00059FD866|nr:hypothetical protein [Gilvimarinus agarilyticus]